MRQIAVVKKLEAEAKEEVKKKFALEKEDVINGFLDAVRAASNSMEMVAAWREIGRIIGAYEPQKIEVSHEHKLSAAQVQSMSNEQLLRLADFNGEIIEGEFEQLPTRDSTDSYTGKPCSPGGGGEVELGASLSDGGVPEVQKDL